MKSDTGPGFNMQDESNPEMASHIHDQSQDEQNKIREPEREPESSESPSDHTSNTPQKQNQNQNYKRRMSLVELMRTLPPPSLPISGVDGIPEKNLPRSSPEERKKLDGISRAIYDIQREQLSYFNESQVDYEALRVNPFKTFDQLSAEQQRKYRDVQIKVSRDNGNSNNGDGEGRSKGVYLYDDLREPQRHDNDKSLKFGKIRMEDGEEVYGIWNLPDEDQEEGEKGKETEGRGERNPNETEEGNQKTRNDIVDVDDNDGGEHKARYNAVLKRLNEYASNELFVHSYITASTSQSTFWTRNSGQPPEYTSTPPSPLRVPPKDENAEGDVGMS